MDFSPIRIPSGLTAILSVALLVAVPADAADIKELRSLLGVTVGTFQTARPPQAMVSMETRAPCGCPDFCRIDVATAGPGTSIAARWIERGGLCGADLMTVQTGADGLFGVDAPNIVPLYGKSPEAIIARYGKPASNRPQEGQLVYCELSDDKVSGSAALSADLVYYGFQFSTGLLTAIRVGFGPVCPDLAFVPVP